MITKGIVVYQFGKQKYALRECSDNRRISCIEMPNFMDTGLALVGLLDKNESVYQFVSRINAGEKRREKENGRLWQSYMKSKK